MERGDAPYINSSLLIRLFINPTINLNGILHTAADDLLILPLRPANNGNTSAGVSTE